MKVLMSSILANWKQNKDDYEKKKTLKKSDEMYLVPSRSQCHRPLHQADSQPNKANHDNIILNMLKEKSSAKGYFVSADVIVSC